MGDYENRKRGPDDGDRPRKQRRTGKIVKILCPFYSAGAIIGKGGEQIKMIKDKTDASIEVSKNTVRFPNTDERVISIQGELEALQEVVKFVQEKIRTDKIPPHVKNIDPTANDKRKAACKIIVSDRSVGKIIGKGGENVNQLKDRFNVKVNIMKKEESIPNLGERIVSVEGEFEDVDSCVSEIIAQVFEHDNAHLDYYVDYSKLGGRGFGNDSGRSGGYDRGYDRGGYSDRGGYDRGGYDNRSSGYDDRSSGYGGGQGGYGNADSYSSGGYSQGYGGGGYNSGGYGQSGGYGGQSYGSSDRQGYSSSGGGGGRGYDY